jgi:hypothetical protein
MYEANAFFRKILVNIEFALVNDRPEQRFGNHILNSGLKGM